MSYLTMDKERIGLKEAARVLGKSPRQIMRYVKARKLGARGGGRGIPLVFDRTDAERLRRGSDRADMLARVIAGYQFNFHLDKLNEEGTEGDSEYFGRQVRGAVHGGKVNLADFLRRPGVDRTLKHARYPRLEDVPVGVLRCARHLTAQGLRPSGVDFLAALFVLADGPDKRGRPQMLEDRMRQYPGIRKAVSLVERHLAQKGRENLALALSGGKPDFTLIGAKEVFLQAVFAGDEDGIRSYVSPRVDKDGARHEAAFPNVQAVLQSVIAEAHKRKGRNPVLDAAFDPGEDRQAAYEDRKRKPDVHWLMGSRLPFLRAQLNAGRIAAFAGLHRVHGYRLAKHVAEKIGSQGVLRLADLLGCGVPDAREFFLEQLSHVFRSTLRSRHGRQRRRSRKRGQ